MNTLLNKVAQNAGLTNDRAQKTFETVASTLKENLPCLMHKQIDILISGGKISDGIKSRIEELKEHIESSAKDFGWRAQEFSEEVGKKLNDLFTKKQ